MTKYTNYSQMSLLSAVWLAANHGYDLKYDPRVYSATTLLKSIRSVILGRRMEAKLLDGSIDVSDLVPAAVGSAVHTSAEVAWSQHLDQALFNLGIPPNIIQRIVVNAPNQDDPDAIYVYMELRAQKKIAGRYVSGKFDFVYEGRVWDIKTTKVYNWIHGGNDEKYAQQCAIYRWLNPDIITDDFMNVEFIFTDWTPLKAQIDKKYPQNRVMTRTIKMMSIDETESFISKKIEKLKLCEKLPQEMLPQCTPDELWMNPTKYAYYKNGSKSARATKLYDTMAEALHRKAQEGKGLIVARIAEPKFCNYCEARPMCMQAAKYINDGILKL